VRGKHSWRRRRLVAAGVVAVISLTAVGLLAGGAGAGKRDITLTVDVFGDFGYKDLYAQYQQSHPGITIKEDSESYPDHHSALAQHLATGAGADDVEAIEVGFIGIYTGQSDKFVDLREHGASSLLSRYPKWKADQAIAPNGTVVGLGTDVGSLGICYRTDLFKKAGLPTAPAAVSKLVSNWDSYIATGQRFQAKAPKGVHFMDTADLMYNSIIAQQNPGYYDSKGNVIVSTNPKVRYAWNEAMKAVAAGISAGITPFSNDWNTGFKKGTFATVTCPAWMMGYIQGQAPATKGKWNIAAVPVSGGSWGGSFLTVPKQSQHQAEAADLVKFLTSPASELYVFKHTGNLPSEIPLLNSKAVQSFRNPFFSNAPVGAIFAKSALKLTPSPLGPHSGDFQNDAQNAITRVETHKQSPDAAWKQFLKDVKTHSS
jgi:cellobiose transport system substrate-binding protein